MRRKPDPNEYSWPLGRGSKGWPLFGGWIVGIMASGVILSLASALVLLAALINWLSH